MVLSLIIQNSHNLPRSGESNTPEIVQNIPKGGDKSNTNSEQAVKNLLTKKNDPDEGLLRPFFSGRKINK